MTDSTEITEIYIGYFDCCNIAVENEIEDGKPTTCPECGSDPNEIVKTTKNPDNEHSPYPITIPPSEYNTTD